MLGLPLPSSCTASDAQAGPSVSLPVIVTNAAPVITNVCPVDGGFGSTGSTKIVDMNGTDDCNVVELVRRR